MDSSIATLDDLIYAIGLCPQKRVALQAGGHWGVWPALLSHNFKMVYTFEPEHAAFQILSQCCAALDNIIKLQACLGDSRVQSTVSLRHEGKNGGATHIEAAGFIPVVCIDNLHLPNLDLLYLDIEGFEAWALRGGERTIKEHKPVIALEMKGLGMRYHQSDAATQEMLEDWGYEFYVERRNDKIFLPKKS